MKIKIILGIALVAVPVLFIANGRRNAQVIPSDLRDAPAAVEQLSGPAAVVPAAAEPKNSTEELDSALPPKGEEIAPAVPGDVCGDGKPHTFRLAGNRDRLLATLAAQKGTDVCTLWSKLSLAEQSIFDMTTTFLGSCDSRLNPPPSFSDETLLDHARELYSINAPGMADITASPVPSMGGACGGFNSNRAFFGFDKKAIEGMRVSHEDMGSPWGGPLNPKHKRGYNWWRASNDPGGPHHPFTARDMICWGGMPCWLRVGNSLGPTMHFFAKDSDVNPGDLEDTSRPRIAGRRRPAPPPFLPQVARA